MDLQYIPLADIRRIHIVVVYTDLIAFSAAL